MAELVWLREDPLVHPYKWLRADLVPPALFLQGCPLVTPGGSGVLAAPGRIDEGIPKSLASLEEFTREVDGWLPLLPEVSLLRLSGEMLAEVVHRKGETVGSLDGWGWREFKALPVSWFAELARVLSKVEENAVWLDGLLDACNCCNSQD